MSNLAVSALEPILALALMEAISHDVGSYASSIVIIVDGFALRDGLLLESGMLLKMGAYAFFFSPHCFACSPAPPLSSSTSPHNAPSQSPTHPSYRSRL